MDRKSLNILLMFFFLLKQMFSSFYVSHNLSDFVSLPKSDMLMAISNSKPTVNEDDLKKLQKFTEDFGIEG